jgi:hypothetical protein
MALPLWRTSATMASRTIAVLGLDQAHHKGNRVGALRAGGISPGRLVEERRMNARRISAANSR